MSDSETVLWALVVAAYHLEKLNPALPTELEAIRKLLSRYSPQTVSSYFLKAAITFEPPRSLQAAQSLYEHYGLDSVGLDKMYPATKPQ